MNWQLPIEQIREFLQSKVQQDYDEFIDRVQRLHNFDSKEAAERHAYTILGPD